MSIGGHGVVWVGVICMGGTVRMEVGVCGTMKGRKRSWNNLQGIERVGLRRQGE